MLIAQYKQFTKSSERYTIGQRLQGIVCDVFFIKEEEEMGTH